MKLLLKTDRCDSVGVRHAWQGGWLQGATGGQFSQRAEVALSPVCVNSQPGAAQALPLVCDTVPVWYRLSLAGVLLILVLLSACTTPAVQTPDAVRTQPAGTGPILSPAVQQATQTLLRTPETVHLWEPFPLPGKVFAPFEATQVLGRQALGVSANESVSILRQRTDSAPVQAGQLNFAWKVDALAAGADLSDAEYEDSPVRVVLAFDGDRTRLSSRVHMLSELTRLLTGEPLPYATLAYVWSNTEPVGTVILNPRTDRIRKLVVASGTEALGQWRDHQRDVQADFVRAFGETPGPLLAVALMTDTDNTQSRLSAWYGALKLQAHTGTVP